MRTCFSTAVWYLLTLTMHAQYNGFKLENLRVPKEEIVHGGPSRDGIPSIDKPVFVSTDLASHLQAGDRVLGVALNGMARAYPIGILNYHEVVNDLFGDIPVVVTYCPLCGSGMAFEARVEGQRLTFGVSGLLYNSDLLLYDRETLSLWSQLKSEAVSGPFSGKRLNFLPTENTSWGRWVEMHPDTELLSPDTGFARDYTRAPYAGYENTPSLMFPVAERSNRLGNKDLVIGIEMEGRAKAYAFKALKKRRGPLIEHWSHGKTVKVIYSRASNSASIVDEQGDPLPATTLYWFAWYAFHPDTELWKGGNEE